MNELLQTHGCSNVFSIPEGLKELMSDITREVLRAQPPKMYDFIANYLSALLVTREHGILAVKILDDLCDCRVTVSEHLMEIGFQREEAESIAQVINHEIASFESVKGNEKLKETQVLKKVMARTIIDEEMAAKVCQITRNAYRDYWYRKELLEKSLNDEPQEPWEIAAENTLELYKRTKPSFSELTRATERIQAAYRGYHIRKKLLKHLKPKQPGPKLELPGPPIDIAASREIDLGSLVDVHVKEDEVVAMFQAHEGAALGLHYDPMKMITQVHDDIYDDPSGSTSEDGSRRRSRKSTHKSRARSFAKEVLGLDTGDREHRKRETRSKSRHDEAHYLPRDHSPTSLNKKISFVHSPPEVIPVMEVEDFDIQEDIQVFTVAARIEGDGESASSVTTDHGSADVSDFEEIVDESFVVPE